MRASSYVLNKKRVFTLYPQLKEERAERKTGSRADIRTKLMILAILVLLAAAAYLTVGVHFENQRLMNYAFSLRTPKLIVMVIAAFAIGGASIVFQSIINNTIVTPCLLGMNSLYTLIHTAVVFFCGQRKHSGSQCQSGFCG